MLASNLLHNCRSSDAPERAAQELALRLRPLPRRLPDLLARSFPPPAPTLERWSSIPVGASRSDVAEQEGHDVQAILVWGEPRLKDVDEHVASLRGYLPSGNCVRASCTRRAKLFSP